MQLYFSKREAWRTWLAKHHEKARAVWLVFYKPHTRRPSLSYEEAVVNCVFVSKPPRSG